MDCGFVSMLKELINVSCVLISQSEPSIFQRAKPCKPYTLTPHSNHEVVGSNFTLISSCLTEKLSICVTVRGDDTAQ